MYFMELQIWSFGPLKAFTRVALRGSLHVSGVEKHG